MKDRKYLWVDLETTGLQPASEYSPLEVAAVVTDGNLRPLDQYYSLIACDEKSLAKMDSWCTKTHTNSGLLDELRAGGRPTSEVDAGLAALIKRNFVKQAIVAGSSVHFDKDYIHAHFPQTAALLTHRIVDVSSFKEALRITFGYELPLSKKRPSHRAIDDIKASIDYFRAYMSLIRLPGHQKQPDDVVLAEALWLLKEIVITPIEEALIVVDENTPVERPYHLHKKIKEFLKKVL